MLLGNYALKNAEDALKAAKELLGKNVNHIAYHILILAS